MYNYVALIITLFCKCHAHKNGNLFGVVGLSVGLHFEGRGIIFASRISFLIKILQRFVGVEIRGRGAFFTAQHHHGFPYEKQQ